MSTMTSAEKEWLRKLRANKSAKSEEDIAHTQSIEAKPEPHKSDTSKHGFNDVAGMEELKKFVKEGFIDVLNNRECAKAFGIVPPSMLFYGPAGCGKSFFAEKIADELKEVGVHFVKIVPDDLASTLVHGTQEKIGEVFRQAEQKAPTLLFLDEFDAMVPKRSNDDRNYQNGETNEFLCMLNNAADRGVYVLAATNHPERIDRAVLRTGRIDELIYVDMPDSKARESLFRLSLSKLPAADDIDYAKLAELTHGYNCSDISYIIKVASRQSFVASIQEKDQPYKRITQSMLEESLAQRSPSVTSQDLREYERVRAEFSPKDGNCKQQRIGFC